MRRYTNWNYPRGSGAVLGTSFVTKAGDVFTGEIITPIEDYYHNDRNMPTRVEGMYPKPYVQQEKGGW